MKELCVISHTHWDREWYFPLEWMRVRLVDLIDNCLALLNEDPEFIFHLDAQTIVLDDYLTIRTEKREELEKYIKQGRLIVGPWYLQNDFYLTSGEATIRNLLEGRHIAKRFGNCASVGYCADQFGLISQLPQILQGFGIDNCVFGRGAAKLVEDGNGGLKRVPFPSEFIWQGSGDSKVTAIHMSSWYNNAQRFSADIDRSKKMIDKIEESLMPLASTPYLLLMNGVDHLEAQEDLLPILSQLSQRLDEDTVICQTTLEQYVKNVQHYIKNNNIELNEHVGELRTGTDWELLKGTLSSRIYLKQQNVSLQDRLENILEPLYTMLEMSGMEGAYSLDHFRYMWRELMKNHPHDSICGCSRDEVHAHMEDNFARLDEMSSDMLRRGLELAAEHIDAQSKQPEKYGILAVNTLPIERNAVIYTTLDFPSQESVEGFTITDSVGHPVRFSVLSKEDAVRDVFSAINLPGNIDVTRYKVAVYIDNMPPMSMQSLTVSKSENPVEISEVSVIEPKIIENEYIRISASPDGRIQITDKSTGRVIEDAIEWEHTADLGDSYVYIPDSKPAVYGKEFPATVSAKTLDSFTQSLTVERVMQLPAGYDFDNKCYIDKTVDCAVSFTLLLRCGEPVAEVRYKTENRACDHRLRLLIKTGLSSDVTFADTPFDVIRRTESEHYPDTQSRVYPNTSFVTQEADNKGTAVLTCGQHEYELLRGDAEDKLALTVVRSTGVITRDVWTGRKSGDQWLCPQNQCLRNLEGKMGILLYSGKCSAKLPLKAKAFRNAPAVLFYAHESRKFSGGRPAVQDSTIAEIFYRKDRYPQSKIQSLDSFISIEGGDVIVTALKKAEDGQGKILRLWNAGEAGNITVKTNGKMSLANIDETVQEDLTQNIAVIHMEHNKIYTIRLF